jgi:hypothetical protein
VTAIATRKVLDDGKMIWTHSCYWDVPSVASAIGAAMVSAA